MAEHYAAGGNHLANRYINRRDEHNIGLETHCNTTEVGRLADIDTASRELQQLSLDLLLTLSSFDTRKELDIAQAAPTWTGLRSRSHHLPPCNRHWPASRLLFLGVTWRSLQVALLLRLALYRAPCLTWRYIMRDLSRALKARSRQLEVDIRIRK
jgi:hypothetical protein